MIDSQCPGRSPASFCVTILLLAALLLCLSSAITHAAPDNTEFTPYHTATQDYNVHAEKSLTSRVVSKIKPGDAVFILGQGPIVETDYVQTAWFQVARSPDGKAGAGYILADLFLNNNSLMHGTVSFIFERKQDEEHGLAEIWLKAFDKNGKLLTASGPVTTINANPVLLRPSAGNGLSNVQSILGLSVSGEACGIPDCTYYYAWTGKELALLPYSINLGGVDIDVDYNEALIFPNGGAPSDTIIKVVKATEYFNEGEDDSRIKGTQYATQIYVWDGKRAVLQSPEPELFNWFQKYMERWHSGNK